MQDAIYRIVDMQMGDGSFGMWGPFSSPAAEWLQSYAMDFLLRARDQKMAVPAASLQRGLTWLSPLGRQDVAQRAGLCLVRAGQGGPRRCRPGPLLPGHERRQDRRRPRLDAARRRARTRSASPAARGWPSASPASASISATPSDYYGSGLRDRAALLALAQEAAGRDGLLAVASAVRERMVAKVEYTTTQEQAWLVLAARAMSGGGELAYSVDGEAQKATERAGRDQSRCGGDRARRARAATRANGRSGCRSPRAACRRTRSPRPKPASAVERSYYTLDGKKADLDKVRQNDRLVVSINGFNSGGGYHQVALLDLLPAGFEIESVVNSETVKNFPFLSAITNTRIAEARDDRFFAALDLGRKPYRSWWESDEDRRRTTTRSTSPTSCAP